MADTFERKMEQVVNAYLNGDSVLHAAREAGVSTVKARKILITAGLWESETSIKIGNLLRQGMGTEQIAEELSVSVKNVQAYMPYGKGIYQEGQRSFEAIRADKYRRRMREAAAMQVVQRADKRKNEEGQEKAIRGRREGRESVGGQKKPVVRRLHLELNMQDVTEKDIQILKKYGAMKDAISRDILVPEDITLHALNYAILRMFGWQNGHLHHFRLPEEDLGQLTGNQFAAWAEMAGIYFRFPTEDYEDIYWDDDYKEGQSIKTWMRKKYSGPYTYKGYGEHYLVSQIEVRDLFSRWEEITVREFDFLKRREPYRVKLREATIGQVEQAFADMDCRELVERLPLAQVLRVPGKCGEGIAAVKRDLAEKLAGLDVNEGIAQYESGRFRSERKVRECLTQYDIPVMPVTDQLFYRYDYGDGWEVGICCTGEYRKEGEGIWTDAAGREADVGSEKLEEVLEKCCPICIAKDGIELVDDVGGIHGFCEMLRIICEWDPQDEEQCRERAAMLDWAEGMGWTGRKRSPEQTL